jgi:hypothetical protein
MKPAFASVGLMIDLWEKSYTPSSTVHVPVYIVNDLSEPFDKEVTLTLEKGGKVVSSVRKTVDVKGYEAKIEEFDITLPVKKGDYLLKAEITLNGEKVFSVRDIPIVKKK